MYALFDNGWITQELFELWFFHHFLHMYHLLIHFAITIDGHSSHYSPSVICKAANEK